MARANALSPESGFEAASAAYLADLEDGPANRAGTVEAYRTDLRQFALYLYPRVDDLLLPLTAISVDLVRAYRDYLLARGLRPSSVCRKLATLRSLFRYLCRIGAAAGNPAAAVAGPGIQRRQSEPPTSEQVTAALERVERSDFAGARDRAIVTLLHGSGLTLAELAALNLSSLDLAAGRIAIGGRDTGTASRQVPVGADTEKALQTYLQLRAEALVDLDIAAVDAGALFVNRKGRRLHRRTIQRTVKRMLGPVLDSEHQACCTALRQEFARRQIDDGADVEAVGRLLGQKGPPARALAAAPDVERLRQAYLAAHPRR